MQNYVEHNISTKMFKKQNKHSRDKIKNLECPKQRNKVALKDSHENIRFISFKKY